MQQEPRSAKRLQAEELVRNWNLFFNRTVLYSFEHPIIQETIPKVFEAFSKILEGETQLSIMLQESGYFIGSHEILYQPNNKRIAEHLKRFGIEAISISVPMDLISFTSFLDACSLTHANAESFLQYLVRKDVLCFSINNVSLQAVKEGQAVADANVLARAQEGGGGGGGSEGSVEAGSFEDLVMRAVVGRVTASELNANLALMQMMEAPAALPNAMVQMASQASPGNQGEMLKQSLMNVLGMFQTTAKTDNVSIENLLSGMYNMRSQLLKAMQSHQNMASYLAEKEGSDSATEIFDKTAAQLIVSEYVKTNGNVKRMAQVIQRVLPEKRQLQKVLPLIRSEFVKMGVPLTQYYQVINELSNLVTSDQFMDDFVKAGEAMGVSKEELLGQLRSDPKEAAKLIVLASEVKRINKNSSGEDLVLALTEYVEKAGEAMAKDIAADPKGVTKLSSMLQRMETALGEELKTKQLPAEIQSMAEQKLRLRVNQSINDIKSQAALAQIENVGMAPDEKVNFMLELFSSEQEMDDAMGLVQNSLSVETVAKDVANQILAKVRKEMAVRKNKAMSKELPAGIYVRAVLDFFIRFEVNRAKRYDLPFSVIMLAFQGLPEDEESHRLHGLALRGLQNLLLEDLRKTLRASDFVGYLSFNRFIIVLPMTQGAEVPKITTKLQETLNRQLALPDARRIWVRPRCGICAFEKDKFDSYKKIYAELNRSWQNDG